MGFLRAIAVLAILGLSGQVQAAKEQDDATDLEALLGGPEKSAEAEDEEQDAPAVELSSQAPPPARAPPRQRMIEEIVVTATKRGESLAQDVPIAITAFGAAQLERMNFRNLRSLTYSMPNVQLENIGTFTGYASFSIRGQGINSSIPSLDPTVGVFLDGVYMGTSAGLVLDNFDIEGIEVLRGPQGVLFGRNVTGGALLVHTSTPGEKLEMSARAGLETGPRKTVSGSVSGPLIGGLLSAKLAAYYSDTPGWFRNLHDGSQHGAAEQLLLRTAARLTPFEDLDGILRLEHGTADTDGPAGQNRALWGRGNFNFAINRPGFTDGEWTSVTFEPNLRVGLGDGTLTSVTGWRAYEQRSELDVDATEDDGFFGRVLLDQAQFSQELRYAGRFGLFGAPLDVTTGVYYFTQDLLYIERRLLAEQTVDRTGGGDGEFSNIGVFGAVDWTPLRDWTFNLGLRYTRETKDVAVSTISTTRTDSGGDVEAGTLNPNFFDRQSWSDVSPRIGFQWRPLNRTQIYGSWARGFRSGGYNFRNTTDSVEPGPFDAEEQDSYELGIKHDFTGFPARVNAAVFHTNVRQLQRELNVPGSFGVSQTIVNAGNARIRGAEIETRVLLPWGFSLTAFAGLLDGDYTRVTADLNRDGEVNEGDLALEIPRLAPKSWGGTLGHDLPLGGFGTLSSQVSFLSRDKSFFTDTNVGFFDPWEGVNANLDLVSAGGVWTLSVYGNNLTDRPSLGGDTALPDDDPPLFFLFGGDGPGPRPTPTFSPLNPGRVLGVKLRVRY